MIISYLNQKGGVGKTTLSLNTAAALAAGGAKVLLVDADEQQSACVWASLRDETPFTVISMARDNLARDVIRMAADYQHVIIDGPPRARAVARSVIICADLVLVPVEPSSFSTWAALETVQQVQEAQAIKPQLKAAFVVSRKIGRTALGRDVRNMAAESGFPVLSAEVQQRVPFAEAATLGQTIFEWSANSPAADEINQLVKELMTYDEKDIPNTAAAVNQ